MNKVVVLSDRVVLKVTGPDAFEFLQGLITNDMAHLADKGAMLAALLTPQGKITHEFFIAPVEGGYVVDTPREGAEALFKKLSLYKMRANVELEDLSTGYQVVWLEGTGDQLPDIVARFADPRHDQMGVRAVVAVSSDFEAGAFDEYLAKRLQCGVPEGGQDYAFGETFPHEACYDLLNGVAFEKGCYVGQEVVSRMQHRATVRRRIVLVEGASDLPASGSEIRTSGSLIGVLGSCLGNKGLALVRLDRAGKAIAAGDQMGVEGVDVSLSLPGWATYDFSS